MRRVSAVNLAAIILGIAFLYLPIVVLVIYSFNASRLVAVWGGWSTRWYAELIGDAPILDAAFISIRLALVSASAATILGTLAALALARFGRFRGRLPFAAMIYAPLVMPEVVTGLSLLLLFVAIAADRGFWTVAVAHTTMAMCFVTVIVQSRLVDFDMSLEEAAMDLGAYAVAHVFRRDLAADSTGDRRGLDARLRAFARRLGDRQLHHRAGRDDAADPHLFRGSPRGEAGDERGMQHHGRRGRRRRHSFLAARQAQRRRAGRAGVTAINPGSRPAAAWRRRAGGLVGALRHGRGRRG